MSQASSVAATVARVLAAVGSEGPRSAHNLGLAYQAELAADRGKRQQAAAFYTPPHVVDFVIATGLGPALKGRDAKEVLSLRVVDPACGSGVFLAAALSAIEAALVERGRRPGLALRREIAGRCLRGVDIDPIAVELCELALADACGGARVADICRADALLEKQPECDVLLANPPWGQKKLRIDTVTAERLRRQYVTARGMLDPFKLFVELAHRLVVEGGRWAMVLPDIVLLKNHEPTRRLMLEQSALEWVVHAGRVFDGVNLDACVIVGRRGRPASDHRVATATTLSTDWQQTVKKPALRSQTVFARLPQAKFNIIASDEDLARVERLRSLSRLGDRFEIHEGVHSGNRRAALFVNAPRSPGAQLIVGGRELEPFRLSWRGRYIDLDPSAIGRADGGYANLGRPQWHSRKKIVVRRTGDRMVVGFDSIGRYVSNNFFVVVPETTASDSEQRAIAALLGSSFMTWYFRTVQPRVGRLFAELKIVQLADFPLAPLAADQVHYLASAVRALEEAGLPAAKRAEISAALDRQVAAAYAKIT